MSIKLTDDANCFVCGKTNLNGLQLTWKTQGNVTESEFYPSRTHQGWQGLVHGGILAALLDEAMTRLAWEKYGEAMTGELTVRYHRPARIGEKLTVRGEVMPAKGRLINAKAEIRGADGKIVAVSTGKAIKVEKTAGTVLNSN